MIIGVDDSEDDSETDIESNDALEICADPDYCPENMQAALNVVEETYPIEKKRKIIEFWRSGTKLKTLKQIRHDYSKVSSRETLYRWAKQLENREYILFFINGIFKLFLT